MKISVALPCYNCENQIGRALIELDSILENIPEIKDIFIIDNRSPDSTIEAAIRTIETLRNRGKFSVYKNKLNVGLGGSHKVAFKLAQYNDNSHLIIFHGDHQASALDIKSLVSSSKLQNYTTVLGARFQNLSLLNGYSVVRILGNIGLNWLYSMATFKKIYDLGSGLNLFNLNDIDQSTMQNFDNGFTYNMDLLLHLIDRKIKFVYCPIRWSTTDQISNAHALKVGSKTLLKLILWIFKIPSKNTGTYETEFIFKG